MSLQSPFSKPWLDVVDLPCLHGEATEAIKGAVDQLRHLAAKRDWTSARPPAMVLSGPAGVGKTHLFMRLRHVFKTQAVMTYISPLLSTPMTPRYVLGQLLEQLKYETEEVSQLDALLMAMMAPLLEQNEDDPHGMLEKMKQANEKDREDIIEFFLEAQAEHYQGLDEEYFDLLLRVPYMRWKQRAAAMAWLGGRELSDSQEEAIGVKGALSEERILTALQILARLAAPKAPLVLVFDQLESLLNSDKEFVPLYGNLIATLVDKVENIVIVQMCLDTEWQRRLRPNFSVAQVARLEGKVITLHLPNPTQAEALITLWLGTVPEAKPLPWPFKDATALKGFCAMESCTPRKLLHALQEAISHPGTEEERPKNPPDPIPPLLFGAWQARLSAAQGDIKKQIDSDHAPEDAYLLGGVETLCRHGLGFVTDRGRQECSLALKITKGRLSVMILAQPHPRSLDAAIKKIPQDPQHVVVLREKWLSLKPTWKATLQTKEAWETGDTHRWHWLSEEDTARLLALEDLCKAVRAQDIHTPEGIAVTLAQMSEWMQKTLLVGEWPVAKVLGWEQDEQQGDQQAGGPEPSPDRGKGNRLPEVLRHLKRLHIASLERLQRECRAGGQEISRQQLEAALRQSTLKLSWVGQNIVMVEE